MIPNGITAELTGFSNLVFITDVVWFWFRTDNLCRIRKPICLHVIARKGRTKIANECMKVQTGRKTLLEAFMTSCESPVHGLLFAHKILQYIYMLPLTHSNIIPKPLPVLYLRWLSQASASTSYQSFPQQNEH